MSRETLVAGGFATLSWTQGIGVVMVHVDMTRDVGANPQSLARRVRGTS